MATPDRVATARDEAALRSLFAALLAIRGRGGGRGYGAPFAAYATGARLAGAVAGLRFLGPDVAVLHTAGGTLPSAAPASARAATASRASWPG